MVLKSKVFMSACTGVLRQEVFWCLCNQCSLCMINAKMTSDLFLQICKFYTD